MTTLAQLMDATPGDPIVGYDEFGRPVHQSVLGHHYGEGLGAQPSQPNQDGLDMVAAAQAGGFWQPDYREDWGTPGQALNQMIGMLAEGALNGIAAPGRAAQGEPVTYGDVWDTALDWGVLGAPMAAPQGALRAGGLASEAAETPAEVIARILREGRADEITDDMMAALEPNDNMELARLYESGATGMDMPLDEPSRMARAEQMGFEGGWYHGTPDNRDLLREGFATPYERAYPERDRVGPYFATDSRAVARTYADDMRAMDYQNADPDVLPLMVRSENPISIDARGDTFRGIDVNALQEAMEQRHGGSALMENLGREIDRIRFGEAEGRVSTDALAALTRRFGGHDVVDVRNVFDTYTGDGPISTVRMFSDPSLARLLTARFDPRLRHLAHLSAGIGGAAYLGGMNEDQQSLRDYLGL